MESRSGIQQGTLEGRERLFVMGEGRAKAGVFLMVSCLKMGVFSLAWGRKVVKFRDILELGQLQTG